MCSEPAELRREARAILDGALVALAKPIAQWRRKFPRYNLIEDRGMVRVAPGQTCLFTESADCTVVGGPAHAEQLTPGIHWKFRGRGRGCTELTITVNARREAVLTVIEYVFGGVDVECRSMTYPADLAGWQQLMADLRAPKPESWSRVGG